MPEISGLPVALTLFIVLLSPARTLPVLRDQVAHRRIKTIEFVGAKFFAPEALRRALKLVKPGGVLYEDMVEYDLEVNLRRYLEENGFVESEISWSLVPLEDREVSLQVRVTEGLQYRLGRLAIYGVNAFLAKQISAEFHLRPGGIFNVTEVRKGIDRIKRLYADQGFIDLDMIPDRSVDRQNQVISQILRFVEGVQFRIAYVGVVGCGNQQEEDGLRVLINLHPGDIYNSSKLNALTASLKRHGVYDISIQIIDTTAGLLVPIFWVKPKT